MGIDRVNDGEDTCELQKLYCLPKYRGSGVTGKLLGAALAYAAER